jgi:hypothetical protein
MKKFYITIVGIIVLGVYSHSYAQELYGNRAVSRHYTAEELHHLEANDSARFLFLKYYYLYSYKLEPIVCANCRPFSADLFDINDYNQLRQYNTQVTVVDSANGFKIILLSQLELDLLIKNHGHGMHREYAIDSELTELPADFPLYVNTGNPVSDVHTYLQLTKSWFENHPDKKDQIMRSINHIHFIKASDFLKLSADEQQSIISALHHCVILNDSMNK